MIYNLINIKDDEDILDLKISLIIDFNQNLVIFLLKYILELFTSFVEDKKNNHNLIENLLNIYFPEIGEKVKEILDDMNGGTKNITCEKCMLY